MSILKLRERLKLIRKELGFNITVETLSIIIVVLAISSKSGTRLEKLFVGDGTTTQPGVIGNLENFMTDTFDELYADRTP